MSNNGLILPRRKDVGIQLGIGVSSSNLYISSTGLENTESSNWILGNEKSKNTDKWDGNFHLVTDIGLVVIDSNGIILQDNLNRESCDEIEYDLTDSSVDENNLFQNQISAYKFGTQNHWENIIPNVSNSFKLFDNIDMDINHRHTLNGDIRISATSYIPKNILDEIKKTDVYHTNDSDIHSDFETDACSANKSSKKVKVMDPSKKQLFTIGKIQTTTDLRHDRSPRNIFVFASGRSNSTVNIVLAASYEDQIPHNEDMSNFLGFIARSGCYSLDVCSSVKHIKIPNFSKILNRSSNIIAIITEKNLIILKIEEIFNKTGNIKIKEVEPLEFKNFEGFPIVDIAFNPWNLNEYAIIDSKGNWCIGQILQNKKRDYHLKLLNYTGSIFDPEDISCWKQIEWGNEYNLLLVMNRGSLIELDYMNDWQIELIQAKTWSKICDYLAIGNNLNLILTSKEIIFIRLTEEKFERLISWKHNLDIQATSMKFKLKQILIEDKKILFLVTLYSTFSNIIHLYSFIFYDDVLQFINNPSFIQLSDIKTGINSVEFIEYFQNNSTQYNISNMEMEFPIFIKSSKDSKILKYILTTHKDSSKVRQHPTKYLDNEHSLMETPLLSDNYLEHIQSLMKLLNGSLPKSISEYDSSLDYSNFQYYGYQLSEAMNELIRYWELNPIDGVLDHGGKLSDITKGPEYFENLDEFHSLLRQFMEYYNKYGLCFNDIDNTSIILLYENVDDVVSYFDKLIQCWDLLSDNSELLTREIIKDVILHSIGYYSPMKLDSLEKKKYEELCQPLQNIVDVWDMDITSVLDDNVCDTERALHSSLALNTSQAPPVIRSSQISLSQGSFSRKKKKYQTVLGISQDNSQAPSNFTNVDPPILSLASSFSSQYDLSQSQHSSKQNRKRKRIGGFA